MKKEIFSTDYINDSITMDLLDHLHEHFKDESGYVFYKFPTIKEMDMPIIYPDIFMISPQFGIILIVSDDINVDRDSEIQKICDKAEKIDTSIFSVLMRQSSLRKNNRSLKFEVTTLKYLPNYNTNDNDRKIFSNMTNILEYIKDNCLVSNAMSGELIQESLANLEASTATIKPKERHIDNDDVASKAFVLKYIESQIAKLDDQQRIAALTTLDGPQRVRGLAGSGKTIVLCLKAAYLHLEYPDKKILYTFYTKSLYDYIQQLITRFYMKISDGKVPDFESGITILHAWGGASVPGVYYYACQANAIPTIDYSTAMRKATDKDPFSYVCSDFIKQTKYAPKKLFDYVLMDEAQDFSASFYQLCRSIVVDDHLIWGYDELQNIFNVKIQSTQDTFKNEFDLQGLDLAETNGQYNLLSNDIVLPKCYRNMKNILMAAISIGFGVYNDVLIQSLENNNHWNDLGFDVLKGDCSKEEPVLIRRPQHNSPLTLPSNYKEKDILEFFSAEDFPTELDYVATNIIDAINIQKLRADDIVVICLDDRNAKAYFDGLENRLDSAKIAVNNIMSKNYVKGFSLEKRVTLTSVYKAKGNEAAMVFVIGCDVFDDAKDSRTMRNKIFTAFTRAKVWLRISGMNINNSALVREIKALELQNYELSFMNKPTKVLDRDWHEQARRLADEEQILNQLQFIMGRKGFTKDDLITLLQNKSDKGNEREKNE